MPPTAVATPLDQLSWPHATARLTLRRAACADAEAVYAYRRLDAVARWLSQLQHDPVAWATQWEQRLATTLVIEREGAVIGDCRLVLVDAHAQREVLLDALGTEAELMWAFHPDAWGHGYATEALGALVALAHQELGLRRLTACCYADNVASWRLMERLGMHRESHQVRSALHRDGTWRDFLEYALLAPGA